MQPVARTPLRNSTTLRGKSTRRGSTALPRWAGLSAAVACLFLAVPLLALLVRVPLARVPQVLAQPSVRDALTLSLTTAVTAALIATVIGVPTAWWLAHNTRRIGGFVRTVVSLPLVLPPVVTGVALLYTFGRRSWIGTWFEAFGIQIPYSVAAIVIAQTFVAMPFLVTNMESAFTTLGGKHFEAALTYGMSPLRAFFSVVLPAVKPAAIASIALGFARALGEFGATLTFAGAVKGHTQTLPTAINEFLGYDLDAALTASATMLLISCIILGVLRMRTRDQVL